MTVRDILSLGELIVAVYFRGFLTCDQSHSAAGYSDLLGPLMESFYRLVRLTLNEEGKMTKAKRQELYRQASKRSIIRKRVNVAINRVQWQKQYDVQQAAVINPRARDARTGCYRDVLDQDVFQHATCLCPRFITKGVMNRFLELEEKEMVRIENTVGFSNTGRDDKSMQHTTYFRGTEDTTLQCDPIVSQLVNLVVAKLKKKFLTAKDGKRLDALVKSNKLPSNVMLLRYAAGLDHGAWWHADIETEFATVVITVSKQADGVWIHPGSIDEVQVEIADKDTPKEIKESGRLERAREFTARQGGAVFFRSHVAHMVECKSRAFDRVVLSLFF